MYFRPLLISIYLMTDGWIKLWLPKITTTFIIVQYVLCTKVLITVTVVALIGQQ